MHLLKRTNTMYDTNTGKTGGIVAVEEKLSITLYLLCGSNTLDLNVIIDMQSCHCRNMMFDMLMYCIIKTNIIDLNMKTYLGNERAIARDSKNSSN